MASPSCIFCGHWTNSTFSFAFSLNDWLDVNNSGIADPKWHVGKYYKEWGKVFKEELAVS